MAGGSDDRRSERSERARLMAHSIFRPLTAMVSNAQAARRLLESAESNPDEIGQALREISDEGQRAADLLRELEALLADLDSDE